MIVATAELGRLRNEVAMVDGGFDPLHPGHVAYFREARDLGVPLLCNVASDDYVARKHPPFLTQEERVVLIDALRDVDYTHASQTTTGDVLRRLRPRFFAKGADWRDRLPAEEVKLCAEHGIEVVYLDTVLASSTTILKRYEEQHGARRAHG